jgi:hypothetical protein
MGWLYDFLDISTQTANKFYAWGWRGSLIGAVLTAVSVGFLYWGTRVRDHDSESQLANLNYEAGQARERASKLEERAATFEKEAAVARQETEKLKASVAWRRLSKEQYEGLIEALHGQTFEVWLTFVGDDPESTTFRSELDQALTKAGLKTNYFSGYAMAVGLQIRNHPGPQMDAIVTAFNKVGIPFVITEPGKMFKDKLEILVGSKPPPF